MRLNIAETESDNASHQQGGEAEILGKIYQRDCRIAVWRRQLSQGIKTYVCGLDGSNTMLAGAGLRMVLQPKELMAELEKILPDGPGRDELLADIQQLLEMFCCLFDLTSAGIRLRLLQHAMCPKFHVDQIPCRLVVSYRGPGTQWLDAWEDSLADLSGNIRHAYQQLMEGDVALLKGDGWENSPCGGLIHRSPQPEEGQWRLFMSLDLAD